MGQMYQQLDMFQQLDVTWCADLKAADCELDGYIDNVC